MDRDAIIKEALLDYMRWVTEGKPEKQHYYDSYHDYINYLGDGIYEYRIQIYDSPEGDKWIRGKFKIKYQGIEILESYMELI
jgi:hypothetical protein